jgi:hypothetical protein
MKEKKMVKPTQVVKSEAVAAQAAAVATIDNDGPVPTLKRTKINRGSRRRIERAINRLNLEMDVAIKEFDLQAHLVDDEGRRVGDWRVVEGLKLFKLELNEEITDLLAD